MTATATNPLLEPWTAEHGLPPFATLQPTCFAPAFEVALREHRAELDAIAAQPAAPSFDNTVAAFDAAGRLLQRHGYAAGNGVEPMLRKRGLLPAPA